MGPTLVYSERTNEELEELFRTIVTDDEFLDLCREQFQQTQFDASGPTPGEVVHEINMSVFYNVETDRKNPDLQFVQRSFTIVPEKPATANRFSNLKLSKNIEQFVKMHDRVHHQTRRRPNRRATICSGIFDEKSEFAPDVLNKIVEEQLEAARRSTADHQFEPIERRTKMSSQTKFCPPPSRHRIDRIEYPTHNFTRLIQKSASTDHEEIIRQSQQTIRSSNAALKEKRLPLNVKSIDLIEIPSLKNEKHVQLLRYETLTREDKARQSRLTTPLKSVQREMRQKNPIAKHNPHVSKEDKRRRYDQLGRAGLSNNPGFSHPGFHSHGGGYERFSEDFLNRQFHFRDPFEIFAQFMNSFGGMDDDFGFMRDPFADLRAHPRARQSNPSRRATQPIRLSDNFFSPMRLNSSFDTPFENSMSAFNFAFGSGVPGRRMTKSIRSVNGRQVTITKIEENGQTIETTEENGQITSKRINGVLQSIE